MAIYRIRNNLSIEGTIIPRGTLARLTLAPDKLARLEEVNAISRIAAPPLAILPGWETRSNRLEKLNIISIEDLLEGDVAAIAKHMRVKPETVERWQEDVIEWMQVTPPKRG